MKNRIRKLVEEVSECFNNVGNTQKIEMWKKHNNLVKCEKVPINVHLFSGEYTNVWRELIPINSIESTDSVERHIEVQLLQKLFKYKVIKDDDILLPTIWIKPILKNDSQSLFGVHIEKEVSDFEAGSYRINSVINSIEDINRLRYPEFAVDHHATKELFNSVTEAVDGKLPVKIQSDELGASPFDTVSKLRGVNELMFNFIDDPALVHELMNFITDGYIHYHKQREEYGYIEPEETWGFRVHSDYLPISTDSFTLKHCWSYISAQTSGIISPEMYREFIHPCHKKLAAIFGKVYYHGCEDLTQKIDTIKELPGLRRFHISPWTNLEAAVEKLNRDFVLEVHVHPSDTLFTYSENDIRRDIKRILDIAGGCIIDINLSDIETVNNHPEKLIQWARFAKDVVENYI